MDRQTKEQLLIERYRAGTEAQRLEAFTLALEFSSNDTIEELISRTATLFIPVPQWPLRVVCKKKGSDARNFTDGKSYRARLTGSGFQNYVELVDDLGFTRFLFANGEPSAHLCDTKDEPCGTFQLAPEEVARA